MIYQVEILRGLAILLVFLFHIGFPFLPSGFLGVDVFFVISGYLMALLYGHMGSLADVRKFYEKRLNRLLPAYFVVLFLVVVATALIVLPNALADTIRYAWYAALLIPNIGFWLDASYFNGNYFKPIQHFWSLGVELQFYLVFPIIMYLSRRSKVLAGAMLLSSLALCFFVTGISPKTSFFMLPTRAWEFMFGVMLAPTVWHTFSWSSVPNVLRTLIAKLTEWRTALGALAMLAIIASTAIPLTELDHPKWAALAVCALAAFVIVAGLPEKFISSFVGKSIIKLGTYSYSIYLVHFPIIALLSYEPFDTFLVGSFSPVATLLAIALTAVSAAALYYGVEMPLRRRFSWRVTFPAYVLTAVLIILALPLTRTLNEAPYPERTKTILSGWNDRSEYRCGKIARLVHPFSPACTLASGGTDAKRYLLVGNSHTDSIKDAVRETAEAHDATLMLMVENCSLGNGSCAPESVREIVRTHTISSVILHDRIGDINLEVLQRFITFAEADDFDIFFVDPVPEWKQGVVQSLYEAERGLAPLPAQTIDEYLAANKDYLPAIHRLKSSRFHAYTITDYFCTPDCRMADDAGHPFYFDSNHMTLTGAQQLTPVFEKIFTK